ncbi:Diadenosine tetraphosphate (Ap4A) hydrolase [Robiginitalea myxolifaciens]|uniref:Diadenosine tetraphosphate (Ap4A) hydrolase n=1 Tax=Robiginitalea myxolifaciens TaxID=400055 RepID=A0A1I6G119_9FLAO|nr:HIT domain-containing protein [Robiginitalea myxolifaciens]SFR35840.1 Diadenosine tetraphosphate (Ap4A) hydrolase [Robiginitalea myxolifaciens]
MNHLKEYIEANMSMSHIYQPVMIKTLILNGGIAHKKDIAKSILSYDESQIEYYQAITNNMVGRILRKNGIVTKKKDDYRLIDFDLLSENELGELVQLCDQKIDQYVDKRGKAIWAHRRKNRKPVPGSVRYKVLRRARGRCELCGISIEEKAIEVDHIVPKNLGGSDSIDNYQALCYTCNANKRDTDDTDFRNINALYEVREDDCIFCQIDEPRIVEENELALVLNDKYPVTEGHTLIIPKRHCETYFDLSQAELNSLHQFAHKTRDNLEREDVSITGFNIGFNAGTDAGQTIGHCYMHLIPRRHGDVDNPIGGLRNIIPGKGDYGL